MAAEAEAMAAEAEEVVSQATPRAVQVESCGLRLKMPGQLPPGQLWPEAEDAIHAALTLEPSPAAITEVPHRCPCLPRRA